MSATNDDPRNTLAKDASSCNASVDASTDGNSVVTDEVEDGFAKDFTSRVMVLLNPVAVPSPSLVAKDIHINEAFNEGENTASEAKKWELEKLRPRDADEVSEDQGKLRIFSTCVACVKHQEYEEQECMAKLEPRV